MLLIFSGIGFSQDLYDFDDSGIDDQIADETLAPDPYISDFNHIFRDDDDLLNYKKLRSYLKRKQAEQKK